MAGLHVPLLTLRNPPCGWPRIARGRSGSLLLDRTTLAFATPRRLTRRYSPVSVPVHRGGKTQQQATEDTPPPITISMLNANSWEGDDVPRRSVWLRILGVVDSVLEQLVEEADGSVVAHVRPNRRQRQRCGICGRRGPLYDQGEGRRRWRGLDVGYTR